MTTQIGWIVRSALNPALVLCDNGEWLGSGHYGPGHRVGVKVFKRIENARKVRGGNMIRIEKYEEAR